MGQLREITENKNLSTRLETQTTDFQTLADKKPLARADGYHRSTCTQKQDVKIIDSNMFTKQPWPRKEEIHSTKCFLGYRRLKRFLRELLDGLRDMNRTNLSASTLKLQKTHHLLEMEYRDLSEKYEKRRELGRGGFAVVHEVADKKKGDVLACKQIEKERLLHSGMERLLVKEIRAMERMRGAPRAMQLRDVLEDATHVYLVVDHCVGGDLRGTVAAHLQQHGCYTEAAAADLMRRMAAAVLSCHERGVIHRDVKFENFLWSDPGGRGELKLADFGLAAFWEPEDPPIRERCGTAPFMAPEVWTGLGYTAAADAWALGILMAVLLTGDSPFHFEDNKQCAEATCSQAVEWEIPPLSLVSRHARDLLSRLLEKDPARRMPVSEMMAHPWLREGGTATESSVKAVMRGCMDSVLDMDGFRQAALILLARKTIDDGRSQAFFRAFQKCDTDGDGLISMEELKSSLKTLYSHATESHVRGFLEKFDVNGKGAIDITGFTAALLHLRFPDDELRLLVNSFDLFDHNHDGTVTLQDLKVAVMDCGITMTTEMHEELRTLQDDVAGCILREKFNRLWGVDSKHAHNTPRTEADLEGHSLGGESLSWFSSLVYFKDLDLGESMRMKTKSR